MDICCALWFRSLDHVGGDGETRVERYPPIMGALMAFVATITCLIETLALMDRKAAQQAKERTGLGFLAERGILLPSLVSRVSTLLYCLKAQLSGPVH